ncbi:hypothetical protein BCON_0174g00190 [Botryotinia convoluta]|uniref:Uncharacterized protein n=1 Tax=Botryotinia convoluta TaxID=54673 RepID=A0A4Z1I1N2_9HELO|nr:hypothetical protein BCON_0174g00190 [Botryotinia convoluta]
MILLEGFSRPESVLQADEFTFTALIGCTCTSSQYSSIDLDGNLSFGRSTPRTYNERYYYVQDPAYCERSSANAACIAVELLRLSRSVKELAAWTARSMRGADMNSALHTLARVSVGVPRADESFLLTHADSYLYRQKQDNIDRWLQSLSDQQTKRTISRLHTHPSAARRRL